MAALERRVGREAMRCPLPTRVRDMCLLPVDRWRACSALVEGARQLKGEVTAWEKEREQPRSAKGAQESIPLQESMKRAGQVASRR